jgi:arginyl-tRNA synthetase
VLPHKTIESRLQQAVSAVLPGADVSSVLVRPCPDPKFGDYQTNALMGLAKERKMNPRQLATDVLSKLDVNDICEKVEIAGAGFLNFRLKTAALAETLQSAARGEHLFFEKTSHPRTIVIDFSSPNVAKPMHVGHIRSTILGDSLARTLRLLGHKVITDNHIGDWGTQFGKLLVGWKNLLNADALLADAIAELEWLYKVVNFTAEVEPQIISFLSSVIPQLEAGDPALTAEWKAIQSLPDEVFSRDFGSESKLFDFRARPEETFKVAVQRLNKFGFLDRKSKALVQIDKLERFKKALDFATRSNQPVIDQARQELVKLQNGDKENLGIWEEMIKLSEIQFETIYDRLGVKFDYTLGESFYNSRLKGVVQELKKKDIARESEGAMAVFSDGSVPQKQDPFLKQEDGEWKPNPCIVQKSDGAANYATTDLATLAYRLETWNPAEIIYVTDGRQQLHFQQIFATFRRWHPEAHVKLAHVWFGSILGEDGKPFKTRSGETVKLADLLDEAEERAYKVVCDKDAERETNFSEEQKQEIARVIGLGAIKYADLLPNRQSDYIFSWDKMLALSGNTAPYMQYAYTRVRGIFRKGGISSESGTASGTIALNAPEEIALAKHLLNFGLVLEAVGDEYRPNYLCNYLYELAGHFARFFESCPVLKSEPAERASRLVLCDLTARVLKQGLEVLGIEVLEQM